MSFQAIAAVLNHSQASPGAKLVLTILANFDGDEGAWPSQETIARMANVKPRQIRRYLAELLELGELEIDQHQGISLAGSRPTNRYYIVLDCPVDCDQTINHKAVVYGTSGGRIRPVRRSHKTNEAVVYDLQTYIEPIVNQNKPTKLEILA